MKTTSYLLKLARIAVNYGAADHTLANIIREQCAPNHFTRKNALRLREEILACGTFRYRYQWAHPAEPLYRIRPTRPIR